MTRQFTPAVDAAFESDHVTFLAFVELDLPSGFVRLTNAPHNVTWNGFTWLGAANLGQIEPVREGTELEMYGIALQLSAIPQQFISSVLNEQYQGRAARLWFAPLDTAGAVIANPAGPFEFRLDVAEIELGQTGTIRLTAESRLTDWDRPRVRRFNASDQNVLFPLDRGLDFVEQMTEIEIVLKP